VKNLCMLRGLIALAKTNRNLKCALFSLDLEKAFYRVNHQYLWKVLVGFGYLSDFINIIKSLYHHAGSKILINGFLTEKIMISRSDPCNQSQHICSHCKQSAHESIRLRR
jgi:hypothetical protein